MERTCSGTETDPSTVVVHQAILEEGSLYVMDCGYCVLVDDGVHFCERLWRIGIANKIYCDKPKEETDAGV